VKFEKTLNLTFLNFVLFHLVNEQKLLLRMNVTVTQQTL